MEITPLGSWECFACGPDHPKGLRLRFTDTGETVRTELLLGDDYTGTGSVLHGGILATVFDEVMSWALLRFQHRLHVTARMETRYRRPALAGVPLVAEAKIDRVRGRGLVEVSAWMYPVDDPAAVIAESIGVYMETPEKVLDTIPPDERRDLDALLESFAAGDLSS